MIATLKSALLTAARIVSFVAICLPLYAQERPADPVQADGVQAITAPSADITLSFVVPGGLPKFPLKKAISSPKGKCWPA